MESSRSCAGTGRNRLDLARNTSLFWPDADPDKASHSLRQSMYAMRQELGAEVVRSESILTIDSRRDHERHYRVP